MRRTALICAIAPMALGGCDRIPFFQDDSVTVEANGAAANASVGGNASTVADAGITSSRSLSGLAGNSGGQGGKDPNAIRARASEGGVDPRLVGRWTDSGDCKSFTELRPDGTFVADNGVVGRWEVNGEQLVLTNNGNEFRLRIDSVEANRIVTTSAQGQTGPSTRC
jgi:hypothetical protein